MSHTHTHTQASKALLFHVYVQGSSTAARSEGELTYVFSTNEGDTGCIESLTLGSLAPTQDLDEEFDSKHDPSVIAFISSPLVYLHPVTNAIAGVESIDYHAEHKVVNCTVMSCHV